MRIAVLTQVRVCRMQCFGNGFRLFLLFWQLVLASCELLVNPLFPEVMSIIFYVLYSSPTISTCLSITSSDGQMTLPRVSPLLSPYPAVGATGRSLPQLKFREVLLCSKVFSWPLWFMLRKEFSI